MTKNKENTLPTKFFRVKNFDKYQPKRLNKHQPWICLYVDWSNDWAVMQLHDSYKCHWLALICTAHTTDNRIPYDSKWIKTQHGLRTPVKLEVFEKLGLIEIIDPLCEIAQEPIENNKSPKIKENKVKENKYEAHKIELFEDDWRRLPRKDGNKKKALKHWMESVGKDIAKMHPLFRKKLTCFCKSVAGREKQFIKTGETFMNQWQDLEFDSSSPSTKLVKTGGAVL